MKYIITSTSGRFGGGEKPHKDAIKETILFRRVISTFKTLEEWKAKFPKDFIDNPDTGYTKEGKPYIIRRIDKNIYTINIDNINEFVDSIDCQIIINPKTYEYLGLEDCNEIEIYDDYRE